MKKHILLIIVILKLFLVSCHEDEYNQWLCSDNLKIDVALNNANRTIVGSNQFEMNSQIGVSLFTEEGIPYQGKSNNYSNVCFINEDVNGKTTWRGNEEMILDANIGKAIAYYPYKKGIDLTAIPLETASQTDYMYSDWVYDLSASKPQAFFLMNHALCMFDINFIYKDDNGGHAKLSDFTIQSRSITTIGVLNALDGTITDHQEGRHSIEINEVFDVSTTLSNRKVLAVPLNDAIDLKITFNIGETAYETSISEITEKISSGFVYKMNLLIDEGKAVVVDKLDIIPWNFQNLNSPEMSPVEFEVPDQYVVKIEVPSDNFTFYSNVYGFTGVIDWGDGNSISYDTSVKNPQHVYKKKGTYFVIAKGKCDYLNYDEFVCRSSAKIVTDIVYIGSGLGIFGLRYAFSGCSNLRILRKGIFDNLTGISSFWYTFRGCSGLQNIPQGLFDKNVNVTDFGRTFWECSSLQSIPVGLFDKNVNVTSFGMTFNGCTSLKSIPAGLFDKCTQVTDFGETFKDCSSLQSIPQGLFDKNVNVTSFVDTFWGCRSLKSIPTGLFDKNVNVTDFRGTFSDCTGLQSIPAGLFDKNVNVTDFRGTFSDCSGLRSIPQELFDKNVNVTRFGGTFSGCTSLQSIPAGLFDKNVNVTDFRETFNGCSSLKSIPTGLFDKCTQVTDFRETFWRCSGLQNIPAGLFDKNVNVTDFGNTFNGCTSLQSIPAGLFDKNVNVTSFGGTFGGCTSLQSVPAGLFDKCTQVTNFGKGTVYSLDGTFGGCRSLQSIPAGLFDKNVNVTSFGDTFNGCRSLQSIPAGLFDKNVNVTSFRGTFNWCDELQSIPAGLFDKCTQVTDFEYTFCGCRSLTGESPYTEVYDEKLQKKVKVHLYERENYTAIFTAPTSFGVCFRDCSGLEDYKNNAIPSTWR